MLKATDWLTRVFENLEEELYGACPLIDSFIDQDILFIKLNELEEHPAIEVYLNFEELEEYIPVAVIHFDPYNQEFYERTFIDGREARLFLKETTEILNTIHEAVHHTFTEVFKNPSSEEAVYVATVEELLASSEELNPSDFLKQIPENSVLVNFFDNIFNSQTEPENGCSGEEQCDSCDCKPEHIAITDFQPEDIEWITEEIMAFKNTEKQEDFRVTYQLGKLSDELVLARNEISLDDAEAEERLVHLFFFHNEELKSVIEVLQAFNLQLP